MREALGVVLCGLVVPVGAVHIVVVLVGGRGIGHTGVEAGVSLLSLGEVVQHLRGAAGDLRVLLGRQGVMGGLLLLLPLMMVGVGAVGWGVKVIMIVWGGFRRCGEGGKGAGG